MFYELNRERTTKKIHYGFSNNLTYPPHMHNCFEIIYVNHGILNLSVMNTSYILNEHDLMLISPNTPHEFTHTKNHTNTSDTDNNLELLFISNTYIDEATKIFDKNSLANPITTLTKEQHETVLKEIYLLIDKDKNPLALKGLTYVLFDIILSSTQLVEKEFCISNDLTYKILRTVGQNYNKPISLYSIAKTHNVCQTYVSRIFNNNLGISFNAYISHLRVEKSCALLLNSDDSIVDIAIECGFDSQRSFNRTFKKITNQSPNEYRKSLAARSIQ